MSGGANAAWPPKVRAEALALAAEVGPKRAAQEFDNRGIPVTENTIRSWVRRAGKRAHDALELAGHVAPELLSDRAMAWPERRALLLPELGVACASALEACKVAIRAGRSVDARNYATVTGILTDKLALLGDTPTSRSEQVTMHVDAAETLKLRAEIDRTRREIAELEEAGRNDGRG